MLSPLIPNVLPPAGLPIPVDGIQCSFPILGFFSGNSRNSINPRLVLFPEYFEIKVLNTKRHVYSALKQVSYKAAWFIMQEQVILELHDGTEYYLKLSYDLTTKRLLHFFRQRGLPLSATAQKALAT